MDNLDYKIGLFEAQVTELQKDVTELKETLEDTQSDVKDIKEQLLQWKSTATGALTILSIIGSVILYFADNLIAFIKIKLGF